jgi:hypothetical protein
MTRNDFRVAAVWAIWSCAVLARGADTYDSLISQAEQALNAKRYSAVLSVSERAIALEPNRYEAYVYAAKGYDAQRMWDDEIGMLQTGLPWAPQDKKQLVRDALFECRKQLVAQSVSTPAPAVRPPGDAPQTAATQAEVVLWKTIENSNKPEDYQAYLARYGNGAFAPLATARFDAIQKAAAARAEEEKQLAGSRWTGRADFATRITTYDHFPVPVDSTDKHHRFVNVELIFEPGGVCSAGTSQRCVWEKHGTLVTAKMFEDKQWCAVDYTLNFDGSDMTGVLDYHSTIRSCHGGEDQITLHRAN